MPAPVATTAGAEPVAVSSVRQGSAGALEAQAAPVAAPRQRLRRVRGERPPAEQRGRLRAPPQAVVRAAREKHPDHRRAGYRRARRLRRGGPPRSPLLARPAPPPPTRPAPAAAPTPPAPRPARWRG